MTAQPWPFGLPEKLVSPVSRSWGAPPQPGVQTASLSIAPSAPVDHSLPSMAAGQMGPPPSVPAPGPVPPPPPPIPPPAPGAAKPIIPAYETPGVGASVPKMLPPGAAPPPGIMSPPGTPGYGPIGGGTTVPKELPPAVQSPQGPAPVAAPAATEEPWWKQALGDKGLGEALGKAAGALAGGGGGGAPAPMSPAIPLGADPTAASRGNSAKIFEQLLENRWRPPGYKPQGFQPKSFMG